MMGPYTSPWQTAKYFAAYHLRTLETFIESRKFRQPATLRMIFLGDSRAKAWPVPAAVSQYRQVQFINRGMGLDTSAQTLQRLEKHVLPLRPNVILLQTGVNDFKYVALAHKPIEQIVSDLVENTRQIVTQLIQQDSHVILSSIFPICFERWQDDRHDPEQFAEGVSIANQSLGQFMQQENLYFFDAAGLLTEGMAVPAKWALDGLHINTVGYQLLNRQLKSILTGIS
jgi:lysophospholipase L1-like esterase